MFHPLQTWLGPHIESELLRRDGFALRGGSAPLARQSQEILAVEELLKRIESQSLNDGPTPVDRNHPLIAAYVNLWTYFYETLPELAPLHLPLRLELFKETLRHVTDQEAFGFKAQEFHRLQVEYIRQKRERRLGDMTSPEPRAPDPRHADSYTSLTDLLTWMHDSWTKDPRADARGVLLQTRTGAGKTASCLKAFYDCLPRVMFDPASGRVIGDRSASPPPLLGKYVPCWLPITAELLGPDVGDDLLMHLMQASGYLLPHRKNLPLLQRWLQFGPPVLIFADLNAAPPDRHQQLAEAMVQFQRNWGEYGHRCVVTYRSTGANTGPIQTLMSGPFGCYDILPVEIDEALTYFENLRSFERRLARQSLHPLGVCFDDRDPDQERDVFSSLADNAISSRSAAGDSVVSTPVLMHFFSTLPPNALRKDATLAELYAAVVKAHLHRELTSAAHADDLARWKLHDRDAEAKLLTAMTRVALAIQSQGAAATRWPLADLDGLLRSPETDVRSGQTPDWWPRDPAWTNSRIYREPFGVPSWPGELCNGVPSDAILEISLLRREGDTIGFLHDSLMYYFCGAVALVEGGQPGIPIRLDESWAIRVTQRMLAEPQRWVNPALFLSGRLLQADRSRKCAPDTPGALDQLLVWLVCVRGDADWLLLLQRFLKGGPQDTLLSVVDWSLRSAPGYLRGLPVDTAAEVHRQMTTLQSSHARVLSFLTALTKEDRS